MDIIIRKATIKDLFNVQELNLELFKKEHKEYDPTLNLNWTFGKIGTKYFKERISRRNSCVLVAIVGEQVVGYLCGGLKKAETYRNLPITAELENIFILDGYRSKGMGKKLYREFIKWCRGKHVRKIRVNAFVKNKLAIKFYKVNKFKEYSLNLEADL